MVFIDAHSVISFLLFFFFLFLCFFCLGFVNGDGGEDEDDDGDDMFVIKDEEKDKVCCTLWKHMDYITLVVLFIYLNNLREP